MSKNVNSLEAAKANELMKLDSSDQQALLDVIENYFISPSQGQTDSDLDTDSEPEDDATNKEPTSVCIDQCEPS